MSNPIVRSRLLKWLVIIFSLAIALIVLFKIFVEIKPPLTNIACAEKLVRVNIDTNFYTCSDSWLKKNKYGLWEMYLQGNDIELGVKNGKLAKELIQFQERAFIAEIREMVPSYSYLNFLKYFIAWMNRNLDKNVPLEFQKEIYGISLQASDEFNFIGPAYQRMLNYHAAHDIGHALQNMNLVACTAISANGSRSEDNALLVGRNMDFSMGEDFAKNKIIAFYKPDSGYNFVSITWGGMIGVVSGMNDQGLIVTLNAAKTGIPKSSGTPVSILARQILQYSSTIDEAYALASQSEIFVAESFLISSARDSKTVVIEKSPDGLALFDANCDELILTNHFQSEYFSNSKLTLQNRVEGASVYRWERTKELMDRVEKHDEISFVSILRDQNGKRDRHIGMGNEKAINQLIAHHSIVFKPHQLKIWISTYPYQLGTYLCYDLQKVFNDSLDVNSEIFNEDENIAEDSFLSSVAFSNYKKYKHQTKILKDMINNEKIEEGANKMVKNYLQLNPQYYYPYFLAGEYYRLKGDKQTANELYDASLTREMPRKVDRERVIEAKESIQE